MSPEEKTVIAGIFDRLAQAENQPRDAEAERFIAERIQAQPYAPYVMAQAIYVQEQALTNLNQEVEQLRAQVEELSRRPQARRRVRAASCRACSAAARAQPQPQSQPYRPAAPMQAAPMQPDMGGASGPWGRPQPAPRPPARGASRPRRCRRGAWRRLGRGGSGFLGRGDVDGARRRRRHDDRQRAQSSAFSGHGEASKLADGLGLGESGKESDKRSPADAGSDASAADKGWQDASGGDEDDDPGFDDGGFDDTDFA